MFVSGKHLLTFAILLALGHTISAEYDVATYCGLVKPNLKLPSIDNCQTYYTCGRTSANKATYTTNKCDNGQKFDKDTQSCQSAGSVNCYIGEVPTCAGLDKEHIAVLGTCNQYTWCEGGKAVGTGECPRGTYFAKKNGQGTCEEGVCSEHINTAESGRDFTSVCEIMMQDVYFGSTVSCGKYQICTTSGLETDDCPTKFPAFNAETGNCGYTGNAAITCSRVTGIDVQPDGDKETSCGLPEKGNEKSSETTCSRWFKCDGNHWKIQNCPAGSYYDIDKKSCRKRAIAQPNPKCNRCEYFQSNGDKWVNTVDETCAGYVRCDNGAQVGTKGTCGKDKFFSETAQGCVNADKHPDEYEKYVAANGACAEPVEDCDAKCTAIEDSLKCITTGTCKCNFNEGKCANCKDPTTCDLCKKAADLADCALPSEMTCIVKDGQCEYCASNEVANGDVCQLTGPPDCDDICTNIVNTDLCVADATCSCGLNNGECADCDDPTACDLCKEKDDDTLCDTDDEPSCYVDANEKCIYCEAGKVAVNKKCVKE